MYNKGDYKSILFNSLFCFFIFSGCESGEQKIPAYIHINKISLSVDPKIQGSSSANITDAWVYVDNKYLGTFPLPATIPVLETGSHLITVNGGIMLNGIASTRAPYPLFTSFEKKLELIPEAVTDIEPEVKYTTKAQFSWIEDFEESISLIKSTKSDTTIQTTEDKSLIFEGKKSAIIYLDSKHTFCEFISKDNFALPKNGRPVYLELNYKTDLPFLIGVYANSASTVSVVPVGGGNASSEWKKLYIDLTSTISSQTSASNFNIFVQISAEKISGTNKVLLDNLKLVYQ